VSGSSCASPAASGSAGLATSARTWTALCAFTGQAPRVCPRHERERHTKCGVSFKIASPDFKRFRVFSNCLCVLIHPLRPSLLHASHLGRNSRRVDEPKVRGALDEPKILQVLAQVVILLSACKLTAFPVACLCMAEPDGIGQRVHHL